MSMVEVEQRVDRLETAMSHMAETVERTWHEMREDRLRFESLMLDFERRMDAAKVTEYRDKVRLLSEFFPELAGKTVCPAVASVYLEASVIALLNREKIYGIAMGDETMHVVNLGAF